MSTAENHRAEFDRLLSLRAEITSRLERLALDVFVDELGVLLGTKVDRIELFAPHADEPGGRSVRVGDGIPLELAGRSIDFVPVHYLWFSSIEEQCEVEGGWAFVVSVGRLRRALEEPTAFDEWAATVGLPGTAAEPPSDLPGRPCNPIEVR